MAHLTRQMLEDIITNGEAENLTLEFKRSDALMKTDGCKNELSKDVSAMANSAGGRIIYGIVETNNLPERLDAGADDGAINREWFEQVLSTRIQPKIDGLIITPIRATDSRSYYVIDVPQATSRAPHQAHDKRYYKRQNFQATAMEDYEIRDALRRGTTPALKADFSFGQNAKSIKIDFKDIGATRSGNIAIVPTINNSSLQPAEHIIFEIYFQPQILLGQSNMYSERTQIFHRDIDRLMRVKQILISVPAQMPIFKEAPRTLTEISFTIPRASVDVDCSLDYPFAYRLRCPGYDLEQWGFLRVRNDELHIDIPD